MANYAIINLESSKEIEGYASFEVEQVIAVNDIYDESEEDGKAWVCDFLKLPETKRPIKTSYNSRIRKNYAGIGMYYSFDLDAFYSDKPASNPKDDDGNDINGEYIFNVQTCKWEFNENRQLIS